ncbi:protein YibB [Acinetobacter portensis]|uniref:Protein YibB n=1 Tax=Acinetobacter portensis TaxID=1839785 RepID=A0ABY4JTR4_9GAMM|nr:protein YibB [Acinetobacter portensis]MCK7608056.1 protein YibB [Acinetobacter portensis]MCK7638807.1 protein YibB [Acinetobacter portensis]UPO22838.1 protein YibB [Acinetobacter portensis]
MNDFSRIDQGITIVTAFFDIGRGDWTKDQGHPGYLHRPTDRYFEYFKNLAKLENPFIVYTSEEFVDKILKIREGKKTIVITIDIKEKFKFFLNRIEKIQKNEEFRSKVASEQLCNPEYWSPPYVLVNNLKSYFVNDSIQNNLVSTDLVAWIDFGYCRDIKTLNNLTLWNYRFDTSKMHLFTIHKKYHFTKENVLNSILGNVPFIIGGGIVGSVQLWPKFYELILTSQLELLDQNIVDDDQGVYLLSKLKKPDMIQLNYLGKNNWFAIFKIYSQTNSILDKIKSAIKFW